MFDRTRSSTSLQLTLLALFAVLTAIVAPPVLGDAPTDSVSFADRTVVVGADTVHCRIIGDGPYLFMLHGFTLTAAQWEDHARQFAGRYTVVIADLPGHGGSSAIGGDFNFERAARIMHGLLDTLGAVDVYGAGHSAGAITLLHMAAQRPDRFAAIVLIGGTNRIGAALRGAARIDSFDKLDPAVQQFYLELHPGGAEQLNTIFRQYNRLRDNSEEVSEVALANLTMPTLLAWGDHDKYFPLTETMPMIQALPNVSLWIVPQQGHAPFWTWLGGSAEFEVIFPKVVGDFFESAKEN